MPVQFKTGDNLLHGPEYEPEHKHKTIINIIINNLRRNHDRVAFIDGLTGEELTLGEFFSKTVKVAMALRYLGLQKNDMVAIISENHINYWIPAIACLFNGITVHHLSSCYTTYELNHFHNLTKPKIIFTSNAALEMAFWSKKEFDFIKGVILIESKLNLDIIDLDALIDLGKNATVDNFIPAYISNPKTQVAFIYNSSGTTGLPKGVMITHDNFRSQILGQSHSSFFNFSITKTTMGNLPFCHLFGGLLSIGTLTLGMKTIILSAMKYDKYLSLIEKYKVTNLYIVPPIALFLAKNKMVDNYDLTSITDVLCGAAPLGGETQQLLQERLKVNIRQLYGMTEIGIIVIVPKERYPKKGASGMLIPGCVAKVRDIESGLSLGPYQDGELCFKGDCTCLGYIHNQEATDELIDAQQFVHSGDIGHYDDEGYIYIVDRLKELIKYKGFQVAPAELEDIIISHKEVKDAAVVGIPDEKSGELPFAFVVKQPGAIVTEQDIILHVKELMSVPKQLHGGVKFIEEIPKNPTGKILRRKLRDLLNNV